MKGFNVKTFLTSRLNTFHFSPRSIQNNSQNMCLPMVFKNYAGRKHNFQSGRKHSSESAWASLKSRTTGYCSFRLSVFSTLFNRVLYYFITGKDKINKNKQAVAMVRRQRRDFIILPLLVPVSHYSHALTTGNWEPCPGYSR